MEVIHTKIEQTVRTIKRGGSIDDIELDCIAIEDLISEVIRDILAEAEKDGASTYGKQWAEQLKPIARKLVIKYTS